MLRIVCTTPFSRTPGGFPSFFVGYVGGEASIGDLFPHRAGAEFLDRPPSRSRPSLLAERPEIVARLADYHRRLGASAEAIENLGRLGRPGTISVVTGQQPGVLTGPLYTIYKAATAIRLAREVSRRTGASVVPVFWNHSDDHDLAEAARIVFSDSTGALHRRTLPLSPSGPAVSAFPLPADFSEWLDRLFADLPRTEFSASVRHAVQPRRAEGFSEHFSEILLGLFSRWGLVVVEPRLLRPLVEPLLHRAIEEPGWVGARLLEAAKQLAERGFGAPLGRDIGTGVFFQGSVRRAKILCASGQYQIAGEDRQYTCDALLEKAAADGCSLSAGVALRPVAQDLVFGTSILVAGPNELCYLAQLRGIYQDAGVPMPVVWPRASLTLVERSVLRLCETRGLSVADVGSARPHEAPLPVSTEAATIADFRRQLVVGLRLAREALRRTDPALESAYRKSARKMLRAVRSLGRKTRASIHRKGETAERQIRKLQNSILPGARLQERVLNLVEFLNRHGLGFADEIAEACDPLAFEHRFVTPS